MSDEITNDPVRVLFAFENGSWDEETFATEGTYVKLFDLGDQTWHDVGDTVGLGFPMNDYSSRIAGCDNFCALFDCTWAGDEEEIQRFRLFVFDYNGGRTWQDVWANTSYSHPYSAYFSSKLPVAVHNSGLIACIVFSYDDDNWVVKVSTDQGSTWKTEHAFTDHSTETHSWMDEGQVIIDTVNQVIWVSYNDTEENHIYIQKSTDFGDTWSLAAIIPIGTLWAGYFHSMDATGQYQYVRSSEFIVASDPVEYHFRIYHSNDYAETWTCVNDEVRYSYETSWYKPAPQHTSNMNYLNGGRTNTISDIDLYHSEDYGATLTTMQEHKGNGVNVSTYNLGQYIAYTENGGTIAIRDKIGFLYSANNGLSWRFIESDYSWSDYYNEGVYVIPGQGGNIVQPVTWISM